jgi:hypothetical protein
MYALLLFSTQLHMDHVKGGITLGKEGWIKLRAWSRIGVLVTQLRRLLEAQLQESIEKAQMADPSVYNPIVYAMLNLITHDGLATTAE